MPFGLKNAGSAFRRAMHISLQDSQSHIVETYIEEGWQPNPSPWDLVEVFNNLRMTP
jgi:hypothetical protein